LQKEDIALIISGIGEREAVRDLSLILYRFYINIDSFGYKLWQKRF